MSEPSGVGHVPIITNFEQQTDSRTEALRPALRQLHFMLLAVGTSIVIPDVPRACKSASLAAKRLFGPPAGVHVPCVAKSRAASDPVLLTQPAEGSSWVSRL